MPPPLMPYTPDYSLNPGFAQFFALALHTPAFYLLVGVCALKLYVDVRRPSRRRRW